MSVVEKSDGAAFKVNVNLQHNKCHMRTTDDQSITVWHLGMLRIHESLSENRGGEEDSVVGVVVLLLLLLLLPLLEDGDKPLEFVELVDGGLITPVVLVELGLATCDAGVFTVPAPVVVVLFATVGLDCEKNGKRLSSKANSSLSFSTSSLAFAVIVPYVRRSSAREIGRKSAQKSLIEVCI